MPRPKKVSVKPEVKKEEVKVEESKPSNGLNVVINHSPEVEVKNG